MDEQNMFDNEFDRMYGDSYRNENSNATNPDHVLPGNTAEGAKGEPRRVWPLRRGLRQHDAA